ncbi:MAG: hypothetical protein ACPGAC_06565, partial [Candidatus Puniceispirillaceae bacterium]
LKNWAGTEATAICFWTPDLQFLLSLGLLLFGQYHSTETAILKKGRFFYRANFHPLIGCHKLAAAIEQGQGDRRWRGVFYEPDNVAC